MTTPRRVNYNGADLTLTQLAKAVGISYACLCCRYRKGDRGEQLWRPLDCVGGNKGARRPPSALRGEGVSVKTREQEAERRERQAQRKAEQEARVAALKVALAAELRRPLIDSKLLKPKEHLAIIERVKFCGQRNWSLKGLA